MNSALLNLGPFAIHWYGVFAALAAVAAFLYLKKIALWRKINRSGIFEIPERNTIVIPKFASRSERLININIDNLFFWTVIAGILGARLYHVLNELPFYLKHPELILAVWQGGLAIHGGVAAGALVILYYARKRKLSFLKLADVFTPALLLTLAIARFGNFFNQELFGSPTSLPWGIFIDPINRPAAFSQFSYFHPTFLYQSIWNLIAVILITLWIKKKPSAKDGLIFGTSLIVWGLGRLLVELLRIDQVPLIFGIRLPLLVSIGIMVLGITIFITRKLWKLSHI